MPIKKSRSGMSRSSDSAEGSRKPRARLPVSLRLPNATAGTSISVAFDTPVARALAARPLHKQPPAKSERATGFHATQQQDDSRAGHAARCSFRLNSTHSRSEAPDGGAPCFRSARCNCRRADSALRCADSWDKMLSRPRPGPGVCCYADARRGKMPRTRFPLCATQARRGRGGASAQSGLGRLEERQQGLKRFTDPVERCVL
jgi:hypothetical protein